MRRQRQKLSPLTVLVTSLFAVLFISSTSAQGLPQITETGNVAIPQATSGATAAASTTADSGTATETATGKNTQSTAAETTSDSNTGLPDISTGSTTATSAATTSDAIPPRISSSTDGAGLPNGLPTLPGGFKYPAPSVPPTSNAPYMQKSNLPEGTVFICVGAVLGFVGLVILAWRGLVAWSINRSVKRAALKQSYQTYGLGDAKSLLRGHKAPYSDGPGSTITLEKLGSGHHHQRTNTANSNGRTPNSSLFFSPTAGAGMHTSHRNSGYLPAGYYAAGTSIPGSANGTTTIGGIGRESMRPTSQGYVRPRSMGPSPPVSPSLPPSSRGVDTAYGAPSNLDMSTHPSTSTLNLSTAPPPGRAPSAYLEDLFENHTTGQRHSRQ